MKEEKVIIGNLWDNIIHNIIKKNMLLIHCIINYNLINTTNIHNILRIKEHNKLVVKMITIDTKWENMAILIVEYLHLTKQIPIIPLGNNVYARKKNPNDSSSTFKNINHHNALKYSLTDINQNITNNLLPLSALNQVVFQLKLILLLNLIQK